MIVGCLFSCRQLCIENTIASKDISSLTTGWILTKLGRNDPYMALFNNCSNGSGPLHIQVTKAKNKIFKMKPLKIFLSETTRTRALIFGM